MHHSNTIKFIVLLADILMHKESISCKKKFFNLDSKVDSFLICSKCKQTYTYNLNHAHYTEASQTSQTFLRLNSTQNTFSSNLKTLTHFVSIVLYADLSRWWRVLSTISWITSNYWKKPQWPSSQCYWTIDCFHISAKRSRRFFPIWWLFNDSIV